MRELMLELLTYEPFGKFLPVEKIYINNILSQNYNPPQAILHTLFSDFYHCVQQGNLKTVDWLQQWKAAYGSARLPLLFKKICFYLMVKGEFSESDFMEQIGLQVSRIRKWKISPQFRKYAETDTYSTIRLFRNGVKKPYIVSLIKKLYYEAGRQESKSMTLKKLPTFVDVFAGTGSVAASVVSEGCPPPIVNDYDPVMVCFAWAFTHCKSELCKRIAEFHNYLMSLDFESTDWSYNADDYEGHHDPLNIQTSPKAWDTPKTRWTHMKFYGYSEDDIARGKRLAQFYQKFVMRTRSSYKDVKKVLDLCDRDNVRETIDFNELSPYSIAQIEDVIDYALATFYYYSFAPGGPTGNIYYPTIVDESSYLSYLTSLTAKSSSLAAKSSSLTAKLDTVRNKAPAVKARALTELQLQASSLVLESTGHFSRYLRGAKFYSKDFRCLLQITPSDAIYYWDSPYYLTVGYDVGFSDKDHKDMLDILRSAEFKWIFSMQYNPSDRCACTVSKDGANRKKQEHIIRDYGAYYRGFYAPFQLEADQRTYYVPADAPMEGAKRLYVILFAFDKVKQTWPKMQTETREMLVVNFECLQMIPLHDSAVVLPFDKFLEYADDVKAYDDADKAYKEIVQQAITWREDNIEGKYADEIPV